MRCLYCDKTISTVSLRSLLIKEDKLCADCRSRLVLKRRKIKIQEMEVESFYEYDGMFRSLLLQYKECLDEALKDVFLYEIADYINLRYLGYQLCFIPSSEKKKGFRGFEHLKLMFEEVKLKQVTGLRMKEERCQEGLDLNGRMKMLDNFVYEGKQGRKVLLVDDVVTSGSTLLGAYRSLKACFKTVKVLSIAYKNNLSSVI